MTTHGKPDVSEHAGWWATLTGRADPRLVSDEIDELFTGANPNPERRGCPPRDVLHELARKQRPIGDPLYMHLGDCSPCYAEFRALQRNDAVRARVVRSRVLGLVVAAAVAVVVGAGAWRFAGREPGAVNGNGSSRSAGAVATSIQLDLRPFGVQRSGETNAAEQPLVLPRERLNATLLLPVGSESGDYEIKIIDRNAQTRVAASGRTAIRNFVTTLEAELDLRGLSPGMYQLAERRTDEDWRFVPVQLP